MKNYRFPTLIVLLILGSFIFSACTGVAINSWPGLSATKDTVYVAFRGEVYAVKPGASNATTSTWKFPQKAEQGKSFYAAPTISDNLIVIGSYGNSLYGVNPVDGSQKWAFESTNGNFAGSSLIVNNTILAPSSNNTLYALSLDGKTVLWKFETQNALWSSPATDGKTAFLTALDHYVYALNLSDGTMVWKKNLNSALASSPLLSQDGMLYVGTLEGNLVAVNSKDGTVAWTTATGGRIWSTPALDNNILYIGNASNKILAVSAKDGKILWQQNTNSAVIGGPLVLKDSVVFPTEGGDLVAWSLDGQKALWSKKIGGNNGKLYTAPVLSGDAVVVAVTDGDVLLQALSQDGQPTWSYVAGK